MSAQRLRDAAKVLRERAEAAHGITGSGDWFSGGLTSSGSYSIRSSGGLVAENSTEEEAVYIATVAPPFALAVAEMLDGVALGIEIKIDFARRQADSYRQHSRAIADEWAALAEQPSLSAADHDALAVADAILGADS